MHASTRGTVPGEIGQHARVAGQQSKNMNKIHADDPLVPGNDIPVSMRIGCNPNIRRPKGQNFRVEQGTVLERPPAVKLVNDSFDTNVATLRKIRELSLSKDEKFQVDAPGSWGTLPDHVKKAGINLTFYVCTEENVPESRAETSRLRHVNLTYFTEDDTIQLFEPKQSNAGIDQGKYLRRHRIPKTQRSKTGMMQTSNPNTRMDDKNGSYWTWKDLQIGNNLMFYGKEYHIYGCDAATRRFYENLGFTQPENEEPSMDTYTMNRTAFMKRETGMDSGTYRGRKMSPIKRYMEASRGNPSATQTRGVRDKSKQFLEHDREVLRFMGLWDDRETVYGTLHVFRVYYYLADDEIEILECHKPNDGSERFPAMFKKGPLPRNLQVHDARSRDIEDDCGEDEYYTWDELFVGQTYNFLGRKVLLFDADKFTLQFYRDHLGIDMTEDARELAQNVREQLDPAQVAPQVEPPSYDGFRFGTEEDSLGSFFSLLPRVPRKNVAKLTQHADEVLRYNATLESNHPIESARHFIVSFYLSTDEVAVYEKADRNSGLASGQFLAKRKLRNPDTGDFFRAKDFKQGIKLTIGGHRFLLGEADVRTRQIAVDGDGSQLADETSQDVVQSMRDQLKTNGVTQLRAKRVLNTTKYRMISREELDELISLWNIKMSTSDVSRLFRHFDKAGTGKMNADQFLNALFPDGGLIIMRNGKRIASSVQAYEELLEDMIVPEQARARTDRILGSYTKEDHAKLQANESKTDHTVDHAGFRIWFRRSIYMPDADIDAMETVFFPSQVELVDTRHLLVVLEKRAI